MKVILGLDLSIKSSGYCFMVAESGNKWGNVVKKGVIRPEKYPLHSKDRYPVSTIKNIRSVVKQIEDIMADPYMEIVGIYIEEINAGKGGTISTKSLSFLHGMLLDKLLESHEIIHFIKSSEWRSSLKISTKGLQGVKNAVKIVAIEHCNTKYGLQLDIANKGDDDLGDAICIAEAALKIYKKSQKA